MIEYLDCWKQSDLDPYAVLGHNGDFHLCYEQKHFLTLRVYRFVLKYVILIMEYFTHDHFQIYIQVLVRQCCQKVTSSRNGLINLYYATIIEESDTKH